MKIETSPFAGISTIVKALANVRQSNPDFAEQTKSAISVNVNPLAGVISFDVKRVSGRGTKLSLLHTYEPMSITYLVYEGAQRRLDVESLLTKSESEITKTITTTLKEITQ